MRRLSTPSAALLALLLAALHPGAAAAAPAAPAASGIVIAKNFMFAPASITVKAGTTVIWTNRDEEPHTVVSVTGLFRSAALDTNESFSFTFEKAGTYQYLCTIHPRMIGTIVVE
jgi:plastocyanin